MMRAITINTSDNLSLFAKIFEPEKPNGKILLISSATGVKQQVYFAFANYFAENGFTVITYDYRGIGESKPKKMRGFVSSMRIWGTKDYHALTEFIKQQYPHFQKFYLGHSLGALILGMNDDSEIFEKFVFVATQDAYIGNLPNKIAITATLGFGIAVPLSNFLMGYFPANWFGLGESLPKGSAMDWRTLILNKKSTSKLLEKNEKDISKKLNQETLIISAEDDPWVTMKGMESLMNNVYPNLKKKYRIIKTSESEKNEIGHINFFRSYNKNLWEIPLNWLS